MQMKNISWFFVNVETILHLLCRKMNELKLFIAKHDDEDMGVNMLKFFSSLEEAIPSIHDVKIKFTSDLHYHLVHLDFPTNKNNNGIKIEIPTEDKNIIIKALVYPKTVQVDIGCTFRPFSCDIDGATRLYLIGSKIREVLLN